MAKPKHPPQPPLTTAEASLAAKLVAVEAQKDEHAALPVTPCCGTCVAFRLVNRTANTGECRRGPPQAFRTDPVVSARCWPTVDAVVDYCIDGYKPRGGAE